MRSVIVMVEHMIANETILYKDSLVQMIQTLEFEKVNAGDIQDLLHTNNRTFTSEDLKEFIEP